MAAGPVNLLRRAFLAVVPPDDVRAALDEVLGAVRPAAPAELSWSRPAQWHLTVQFLGSVADAHAVVAQAGAALHEAPAFAAALGGAGAFPSTARASVVWIGLDRGLAELHGVAARSGAALAPLGFAPDPRPFTAHLTVARARRPCPVGTVLSSIGDGPLGRVWDVGEVVLFESDTRPTGAVHREVAVLPLG